MFAVIAAALAIQATAPSSYGRAVLAATFDVCPGFTAGRVSTENVGSLAQHGFQRQAYVEDQLFRARPSDGRSIALMAGSAESPVSMSYWPRSRFCTITFKGSEARAALENVLDRMESATDAYERLADRGEPGEGFPNAIVYRSRDRHGASLISLYRPAPDDESQSFVITFHPGEPNH